MSLPSASMALVPYTIPSPMEFAKGIAEKENKKARSASDAEGANLGVKRVKIITIAELDEFLHQAQSIVSLGDNIVRDIDAFRRRQAARQQSELKRSEAEITNAELINMFRSVAGFTGTIDEADTRFDPRQTLTGRHSYFDSSHARGTDIHQRPNEKFFLLNDK